VAWVLRRAREVANREDKRHSVDSNWSKSEGSCVRPYGNLHTATFLSLYFEKSWNSFVQNLARAIVAQYRRHGPYDVVIADQWHPGMKGDRAD